MNRKIAVLGAILATFFWASAFTVGTTLVANEPELSSQVVKSWLNEDE